MRIDNIYFLNNEYKIYEKNKYKRFCLNYIIFKISININNYEI